MENYIDYNSPIGNLRIAQREGKITRLLFGKPDIHGAIPLETPVLGQAACELSEYFAGERKEFLLPLAPEGTEFQKKVWDELLKIPYGETRTYGEVAAAVGNPKASRAVGLANNRNPISIVVPCHRVIGADNKLTGYGGGLDIKAFLLKLEGRV